MAKLRPAHTLPNSPLLSTLVGTAAGQHLPGGEASVLLIVSALSSPQMPFSTIRAVCDHREGWREEPGFPHSLPTPLGHVPLPPLPSQAGGWCPVPPWASRGTRRRGAEMCWRGSCRAGHEPALWWPGVPKAVAAPSNPCPPTKVPTSCCPPWCKRTTKIQLPVPFLSAFAAACLWKTGAG